MSAKADYDVFIIGGGINGAGIARDASGRGFDVGLAEAGDFAGGTSSASTKLFHGGLRYLEYFEFRLVREALIERETLLKAMPHIAWPMRFVLPLSPKMRFEGDTPSSRLLTLFMPWLKGRRPAWIIRFGLFLYDHLGGRKILPATRTLDLGEDEAGRPLKPEFAKAYEYSDCWVEDSRLVIFNLMDAASRGADIFPRTRVTHAAFKDGLWQLELEGVQQRSVTARMVLNATGPWVDEVLRQVFNRNDARNVRLVRGSHIVVPRKFDHQRSYFFQNADSRILFAIPYEQDYTLIGTTDADHPDMAQKPEISPQETRYLCEAASAWFQDPVDEKDIVWTYSGVRPLYDDGANDARSATRDYVLVRDEGAQGPLINIFGGKITTYRKLGESMMDLVEQELGERGPAWTAGRALPGGDFPVDGFADLVRDTHGRYAFMELDVVQRLCRHYGMLAPDILGDAKTLNDLGRDFGHGLYEREVHYLLSREWAKSAEDIIFRRTKLGVRMEKAQIEALDDWIAQQVRLQAAE